VTYKKKGLANVHAAWGGAAAQAEASEKELGGAGASVDGGGGTLILGIGGAEGRNSGSEDGGVQAVAAAPEGAVAHSGVSHSGMVVDYDADGAEEEVDDVGSPADRGRTHALVRRCRLTLSNPR